MIFQSPLLLGALAVLPGIWWLLRVRPPAPRLQSFPPTALLARLSPRESTAATPPLLLLLLRLLAATLLIVGLSGPVIPGQPVPLSGEGPLLLVVDNDLMAAADWGDRSAAIHAVLDAAAKRDRPVILLPTGLATHGEEGEPGNAERPVAASEAARRLDALRPVAWFADRRSVSRRLDLLGTRFQGTVFYFSNGVATPGENGEAADRDFAEALRKCGAVREIRFPDSNGFVLSHMKAEDVKAGDGKVGDGGADATMVASLGAVPGATPRRVRIRAHAGDGGTLALTDVTLPAGAASAPVGIALPTVVRNRVDMLTVDGHPSAATTLLLDEGDRLRPVGLVSAGNGDTPLVGTQFYLKRALDVTADLHVGTVGALLSQPLSVLIAPDGTLADPETRRKVAAWVRGGGTLIRFAGRTLAGSEDSAATDDAADHNIANPAETLLPVPLMPTVRQLGGAMSWGKPQPLADFPEGSPFRGLDAPKDVTVSRQVLARPSDDLSAHSWARLADGTPLVTHAELGRGEVVLFHVTPTADWSNLPLSGLFVSMLTRLIDHASGVDTPSDSAVLPPVLTLDGEGVLGPPSPEARGLPSSLFGETPPGPEHPPGLYGSRSSRRALNVGDTVHALSALGAVGAVTNPSGHRPDRTFGPILLVMAASLLFLDAVLTIFLRGFSPGAMRFLRRGAFSALSLGVSLAVSGGFVCGVAQAQESPTQESPTQESPSPETALRPAIPGAAPGAALETRLAYVVTGDAEVDAVSREGLQGLSDYVNTRTSAVLGHPDGVRPGVDDLSYYPLLYWPITPDAKADSAVTSALIAFMAHGGMIVIDTQGVDTSAGGTTDGTTDGGGGAEFPAGDAPGSAAALRRVTAGLPVPPLTRLNDHHVLSHTFYLLHDFPGRYAGQPVWVAREGEAENDDVSPVIVGSADWAHAWAVDRNGDTRFAVLPGGDEQRRLAYRFGVNAVIYALTGNYKADQVHVPAILKRLGQ